MQFHSFTLILLIQLHSGNMNLFNPCEFIQPIPMHTRSSTLFPTHLLAGLGHIGQPHFIVQISLYLNTLAEGSA